MYLILKVVLASVSQHKGCGMRFGRLLSLACLRVPFSALTLLVGIKKEHPVCKDLLQLSSEILSCETHHNLGCSGKTAG